MPARNDDSSTSDRLRRALETIRRLRNRLEGEERKRAEPIAIVGMACRFPGGAHDPEGFARLLMDGVEAVSDIPESRLPLARHFDPDPHTDRPDAVYTRRAGLLEEPFRFDAPFFRISPREAHSLDPQHRLALEVSWEALERAAISPESLVETRSGVVLGMTLSDHDHVVRQAGPENIDTYHLSGNCLNFAAGRIAYFLGLQGPTMIVDTACSSSLVAVHLACQSLRSGESDLMLAGGVNVMMSADGFIMVCKMRMVSLEGRCRTFDASADGFVRGEGCGIVVLKRLSDAQRDGDPVIAILRASAMNQDGPSSGLTVPNGLAQQKLMRQALDSAGLEPAQIGYLEAHGTATSLGDPIEVAAIGEALGKHHTPERPLRIGSVKPNVGHLEAAAGVAGLFKAVQVVSTGRIPPHLHLRRLNPEISLLGGRLAIPTEAAAWSDEDGPRIAGVSSFGASGTNAHVIVQQAPARVRSRSDEDSKRPEHLLCLSAMTPTALRELARRYADHLASHSLPIEDVCFTAHACRVRLEHRLAIRAASTEELVARLTSFAGGTSAPAVHGGHATRGERGVVFLFPGQGAQYAGMGRELYRTEPTFREALDHCDRILSAHLERPLLAVMHSEPDAELLNETAYTQPALFAIEYALACMWRSWGVEPSVVVGHSVGEYVAACVAGILELDDALALIACRGRLMQDLPRDGTMAAVFAAPERVAEAIAGRSHELSIAAINSPANVVVSGRTEAVREVVQHFARDGVAARELRVSHAFHSPLMDPILERFAGVAQKLDYGRPRIPFLSNLTGMEVTDGRASSADYWCRHLRETVLFADSMAGIGARGKHLFLEVGPGTTLSTLAQETQSPAEHVWLPTLRRSRGEWRQVLHAAAELFVHGDALDARRFQSGRERVVLPTYPFGGQPIRKTLRSAGDGERSSASAPAPHDRDRRGDAPAGGEPAHDWLYQVEWRARTRRNGPVREASRGAWLLLADRSGFAEALARELNGQGERAIVVIPRSGEPLFRQDRWSLDVHAPEHCRQAWRRVREDGLELQAIVHLSGLDATPAEKTTIESLARDQELGVLGLLPLCQTLALEPLPGAPRLWIVTRRAVPASSQQEAVNVAQAPLWGMGRALALEQPDLWGGLLDLDVEEASPAARRLVDEIRGSDGEDQVAWRGGQRFVPRLAPMRMPDSAPIRLREDRGYLVTGAFGSLGSHLVRRLVARGARHLTLVGRSSAATPQAAAFLRELDRGGVEVQVVQADVGRAPDLERLSSVLESSPRPLAGVFHVAGVIAFESLNELTPETFREVLGPKVMGSWGLHELCSGPELDFFLCFSSIASVWGSLGQIHYAAANHFLDALAHLRRAESLPSLSVSFGVWDAGGELFPQAKAFFERAGIRPMSIDRGLTTLEGLLLQPTSHVVCADLDWSRFRSTMERRRRRPLFEDMGPAGDFGSSASSGDEQDARARILAAEPDRRLELMVDYVQDRVARLMGFTSELPDFDLGFFDLGMDSLMSVALRTHLQEDLGIELSTTAALENPTIRRLAQCALDELPGLDGEPPPLEPLEPLEPEAPATPSAFDERVLIEDVRRLTDDELARAVSDELKELGLE